MATTLALSCRLRCLRCLGEYRRLVNFLNKLLLHLLLGQTTSTFRFLFLSGKIKNRQKRQFQHPQIEYKIRLCLYIRILSFSSRVFYDLLSEDFHDSL